MDESNTQIQPAPNAGTLRPLHTYFREPQVEAQILELLPCSPRELLSRAQETDHTQPGFVREETLIYFLRERFLNGDNKTAGDLGEILIRRSVKKIHRTLAAWKMAPGHVDDCANDVFSQMWVSFFDLNANCQFWEVRFWVCLERLIGNYARKYRTAERREISPRVFEDGEEDERDQADPESEKPFDALLSRKEIRAALAGLTEAERTVFVLWHAEQWTQLEIAEHLAVTDRTVRNLLRRAERQLKTWCEAN